MKWNKIPNTNHSVSRTGKVRNDINKNILTPRVHTGGYLRVQLLGMDYYIHRLVAQAFIPNPENKPEVNHLDLNKTNNHVSNLKWCTRGENIKHGYIMGTRKNPGKGKFGRLNVNSKKIEAKNGNKTIIAYCQPELAKKLNVTRGSIDSALRRNHKCAGYRISYI